MRIALFSDIHANLPALEAFFLDLENREVDAVYCLGDLVGYNIWPNEVIEEIRKRKIPTITGNYDYGIGRTSNDCGCAYKSDEEKANGAISISFTNKIISESNRQYLRNLPSHIRIEVQLHGKQSNLLLVHGSPRKVNEYLFEDRSEKSLLRMMEQADADILCFGHTHKPYHRILKTTGTQEQIISLHAINIGSVGKPKDADPRGGYVILEINESADPPESAVQVNFIRFEYDVEKAALAVEKSELPNAYADNLRNGY